MSAADLQAFFKTMAGFLRGDLTVEDVESALGSSPSPGEHVLFYQQLVRSNHRRIMGYLYPATERALADLEGGVCWRALVDEFAHARPCGHWDLNAFGQAFPDYLAAREDLESRALLSQIADYEYLYYTTTRDTRPYDPATDVVNPTASIRAYTHTVPGYVRAVKLEKPVPLRDTPITILFYRRPSDRMVRFLQPSLPQLLAFAWATGEADRGACADARLSLDGLLDAARALVEAGVIGAPVIADIQARWS